jgi:cytochrome P450
LARAVTDSRRCTAVRSLAEAPFMDMVTAEADAAEREAQVAELRETTSVVRNPMGASIIRYEPVRKLLADPRLISSIPHLVRAQGVTDGRLLDMLSSSVIAVDGEDHTRLRRLVSKSFTPRAAGQHRPAMRALVDGLIDGFADRGRCDFVTDFADHYPVQVICEVLGVPKEHHADFARWGDALTFALSLELLAHLTEVNDASAALFDYVSDLVAQRQDDPRDDLVTSLVQASDDGDRLSPIELFSMIGGLLFAGYDTTRNQLGLAMASFAAHPDQWALLAERPELAPKAVDEVMRLFGAVSGVPRVTLEDIDIDGWAIPANTLVFLVVASGNRDSEIFADALEFDITVEREAHLTFGGGPHFCLGSNLARAEMEEALTILAQRLPNLRLDGQPTWRLGTGISGPTTLPLAFAG